ncbi:DOT1-domain-containing protein [Lentinus tigrinus ALCF2SS1-7]|uniref:Histone-lysine N-methyltransferase, H3 lysine-79 specific n=1 Tax=Lentinus tigrinus ALCF2SS1-6 TaxID=1328759 RepID=A0A5C2S7Y4_9APHY|nr:DOT1-domain-containing protein [Lentinus tigrinus ALCF2SS1-6]RPD68751.1 DOT1-domain-containing protein [Lentinus tigrinus ALCF2SS1-7]
MSSSSTPFASSTDHSFFSNPLSSTSSSSTVVTTRLIPVTRPPDPRAGAPTIKVTAHGPPAPTTSRDADASTKRKCDEPLARNAVKKRRVSPLQDAGNVPQSQSRASSLSAAPSPGPSGSSRQSSLAPTYLSADRPSSPSTRATSVASVGPPTSGPPKECWIEEDGKPGPGFLSSEVVVQRLMKGYKAYFKNPHDPDDMSWEPHPTKYPVAELEYPNNGASERFILLVPKDPQHYDPIMCLESSLHAMVKHYLTPAQQALFGTIPSKDLVDDVDVDSSDGKFDLPSSDAPSPPSSEVSTPSSESSCSSLSSQSSLSTLFSACSISSASSLRSITALSTYAKSPDCRAPPSVDYLRLLRRAIKKHDGPLFLQVMDAINALICLLKYPPLPLDPFEETTSRNVFREAVKSWKCMPADVVQRLVEEVYQRAVGPNIDMLKRYEAFSSEVYGELMPMFVSDIFRATGLSESSLFLDLGSGVGNVVLQATLETGCRSFGIEVMPGPAEIARSQLEQFRTRCRMWGVRMGEVELEEGDMLKSAKVDQLVKEADVVLVNNKVFLEPLNEALRQKFLDLKEGAIVVSLKCLMGSGRSSTRNSRERSSSPALKERNLDDIGEIFTVTAHSYSPGSVSWGGGGGEYFLQRMNREDYARRKLQFENSRAGSARVTRSRR